MPKFTKAHFVRQLIEKKKDWHIDPVRGAEAILYFLPLVAASCGTSNSERMSPVVEAAYTIATDRPRVETAWGWKISDALWKLLPDHPQQWRALDTAHLHWTPATQRCFDDDFRQRAKQTLLLGARFAWPQHFSLDVVAQLCRLEGARVYQSK